MKPISKSILSALSIVMLIGAGGAFSHSQAQCPPVYVFTGEAPGDLFGISVSDAGDVNNDGFDDLVVGATFNDTVGNNSGQAYVYSGQTGALLHTFNGPAVGLD